MTTRPRPATVEDAIAEADQHHDQKRAIQAKPDSSRPDAGQSIRNVITTLKNQRDDLEAAELRVEEAEEEHSEHQCRHEQATEALRKQQLEIDTMRPKIAEKEKELQGMKRKMKDLEENRSKSKQQCKKYRDKRDEAEAELDEARDWLEHVRHSMGFGFNRAIKELEEAEQKVKGHA